MRYRYSKTNLGMYLKELRQEANLKLADVASGLGVKTAYVSMLERGERVPSIEMIYLLAEYFNVPPINLLTLVDTLPEALIQDLKEKEKLKEALITERIRNIASYVPERNHMTGSEILNWLEKNDQERLQIIYQETAGKFQELKNLPVREAILKAVEKEISIEEVFARNEAPDPGLQYLEPPEILSELKRLLNWSWAGLAVEFGVCSRTVMRWATKKSRIPKRVRRKIDFLYWVVLRRIKESIKPFSSLYLKGDQISPDEILSELEKIGLDKEIKRRFIETEPYLKPLKDKTLAEFFYERAKRTPTLQEMVEANTGKPIRVFERPNPWKANFDRIDLPVRTKTQRKHNNKAGLKPNMPRKQLPVRTDSGKNKQEDGNKMALSGDDEGEEGDDTDSWLLKKSLKNRNIDLQVKLLLENLERVRETGRKDDLLEKEVNMSIYRRRDSRYLYINISFNGNRFRMTSRCESRKEAEKIKSLLLTRLVNDHLTQRSEEKRIPTFEEVSEKSIAHQPDKKSSSLKRDELSHRQVCQYLGKHRIDQIRPSDIQEMMYRESERIGRGGKKISRRTVNINRGYVHRVFEFAINTLNLLLKNPVSKVKPLRENNYRDRVLSTEEESRLLVACEKEWIRDIISFVLATGLRIGEVVSLKKTDFHLDSPIPHLKLHREKNNILTEFPIMQPELLNIVNRYISGGSSNSFFHDEQGNAIKFWETVYWFKKAVKMAGLDHLIFHDLRRTFYTRLRLAGCNQAILERLMGHKEPEMVSRYTVIDLAAIAEELKRVYKRMQKAVTHLSQSGKKEE
jgi:integrase/transcriptional regulator with XRE-family HTH domain